MKSVRLRYRHMTQTEDYQTAEMSLDSASATITASIPASFIDKKWDLMYFIEAIGNNGGGRMYPDLEIRAAVRDCPGEALRMSFGQEPADLLVQESAVFRAGCSARRMSP